jgi:predicted dehydrogenase
MDKVTTAIVGCGQRGIGGHGMAVKESDRLSLLAVCDSDRERALAAGEKLGVPYVTDYANLLERKDLDSVIVATGTQAHFKVSLDAALAGKSLLVEKPMVDSAANGKKLESALRRSGIVGMVAYQMRFADFFRNVKEKSVEIDPLQLLMTCQRGMMAPQYFFKDHYGGVIDSASHHIDQALWIMGGPPMSVYGRVRRGTFRPEDAIEFASLMLEYDGGERTANIVASIGGVEAMNIFQIVGRHGSISSIDRRNLRVVTHGGFRRDKSPVDLKVQELAHDNSRDPTAKMLDHFADLVSGREAECMGTSVEEGTLAVAVTQAMAESAVSGKRIPLTSIL